MDELLGEAELHRPGTIRIIDRFTVIPASHRHSRKKAGIQINPVASGIEPGHNGYGRRMSRTTGRVP